MRKEIRFFPQHSGETCGSCCCLMLLDYYERNLKYPTERMEWDIYREYRVEGLKGMTGAAVAKCLSQPRNNLDVHLVQSFQDRMENRGNVFAQEDLEKVIRSHRKYLEECRDRIRLSAGTPFDCGFLRQQLDDGKKIVLQCFVPETEDGPPSILHWVILERYKNGRFRVRDPLPNGKLWYYSPEELEELMDTPVGKICIVVGEPND